MNEWKFFEENGFIISKQFETPAVCASLKNELEAAIAEDSRKFSSVFDKGMVHNCFLRGDSMLKHLDKNELRFYLDNLLCKNAIIYAYQSSSLPPNSDNYGARIHVDCPRFIEGYRTNLGYILALDDFTTDNGGTFVLPGSHKSPTFPSDQEFDERAIQLTCNKGDAIFFDARLFHKAGFNHTNEWRHAITINFCRPFMRSRFDFPKMLDLQNTAMSSSAKKFLGNDVRMPTNLDDFYLPENERLYKAGQE